MTGTEGQEPKTVEARLDDLESAIKTMLDMLEDVTKKIAEVDKKAVKKSSGLFGGKRTKTAIKDTKTGTVYASKAQMGKRVAAEFGLDPGNNFVYYQIITKAPDRFVDAGEEESAKAWADEKVRVEKERAEAQAKLDAEAKAKAEAEAKASKKG